MIHDAGLNTAYLICTCLNPFLIGQGMVQASRILVTNERGKKRRIHGVSFRGTLRSWVAPNESRHQQVDASIKVVEISRQLGSVAGIRADQIAGCLELTAVSHVGMTTPIPRADQDDR